jgi:two-component system OmpR family response regulator
MAIITFLVEDNARIREHLIPTLEDLAGAQVLGFAETESDALEWLHAHDGEWSLAVVDLFLKEG